MPYLPSTLSSLALQATPLAEYVGSGIVFGNTFLFSAITPHRFGVDSPTVKAENSVLLRSALGMGIVMVLMGLAQNIWQFLILRALLGFTWRICPQR